MCFSATASFIAAGVTGVAGAVALTRTTERRDWPLAAVPLFFAAQQSVEGLLWLTLPVAPDGPEATGLTLVFLLFAEVFWPVYAPLAALLIEPERWRRRLMLACTVAGAGVGVWFLGWIISRPHSAAIVGSHIVYTTGQPQSDLVGFGYLAATGLALLLSSHRAVVALGVIVLAGSVAAYLLYWEAFVSVWCFFAAVASGIIVFYFERARRERLRVVAVP